jgi:hypothetical protein
MLVSTAAVAIGASLTGASSSSPSPSPSSSPASALAQPASHDKPPAAEQAAIKKDVLAAMQAYYAFYGARDAEALSTQVFNLPWTMVGGSGVRVEKTPDEVKTRFQAGLKGMDETGYARSVLDNPAVCVLSANAAFVSGTYHREKQDGTLIGSQSASTYLFAKTTDGWRVVAGVTHSPEKLATCND